MTHKTEAETHLGHALGAALVDDHRGVDMNLRAAQVEALLEIGEQLRVANLIAPTKLAVNQYGGYAHQCRTPPVWWARYIRRSKTGREWACPVCSKTWRLGYVNTHDVPGIVPWQEWEATNAD